MGRRDGHRPCPISTSPLLSKWCQFIALLLMSSQNTTSSSHIQSIHISSSQNTTSPVQDQSVHHLSCPWPVRMLPLLSMWTHFTISWICTVNRPCLCAAKSVLHLSLSKFSPFISPFITPTAHAQSEYHLSSSSPISTISQALVILECHISCPGSTKTPSLLPILVSIPPLKTMLG